jgi:hypothetical protein
MALAGTTVHEDGIRAAQESTRGLLARALEHAANKSAV